MSKSPAVDNAASSSTGDGRAEPKRGSGPRTGASGVPRREEIVRIAGELFAQRGYKATTIRMIASEAGILSGSLYYHFDAKEDIADALLRQYLDDLLRAYDDVIATSRSPREAMRRMVAVAFESVERHRAAALIIQNEMAYLTEQPRFAYLAESTERIERLWRSVVEDGVRRGEFREGLDVGLTFRFVRGAVWSVVRWFRSDGRFSAREMADDYSTMILNGISAPEAPSDPA